MKSEQLNLRLEADLIAELERASQEESVDRAAMVRKLLKTALTQRRIDRTLVAYQRSEISIGRACEETGLSHWQMFDLIHARAISYPPQGSDLVERVDQLLASIPHVADKARAPEPAVQTDSLPDRAPRPGGVLLVGINPAPTSAKAGHYYQGQHGQRLWKKLAQCGLLPNALPGGEDDAFVAAGHGLTDLVKRVTASADDLSREELGDGAIRLANRIREWKPSLIIFAYASAARYALGDRSIQPGPGPSMAGTPTFLLAGPYAALPDAQENLDELRVLLRKFTQPNSASTQRVTQTDLKHGMIRLPRDAKQFFPPEKAELEVVLRGVRLPVKYDPRTGPAKVRSGTLRFDRKLLDRMVRAGEVLNVRRGPSGLPELD
ncbi:MAG: uracil-DNA glycosylase family protein [Candidatus Eisenbacteria bacterium]